MWILLRSEFELDPAIHPPGLNTSRLGCTSDIYRYVARSKALLRQILESYAEDFIDDLLRNSTLVDLYHG